MLHAEPVRKVHCIGAGCRHANQANRTLGMRSDIVHPGHDNLEDWAPITTKEMYLVDNYQAYLANVAPSLPATTDAIPLLWSGNNHVGVANTLRIRSIVTCQLHEFHSHWLGQSFAPILNSFPHERFHRGNVDNFRSRLFPKCPPHSKLGCDGLSRTCWGA